MSSPRPWGCFSTARSMTSERRVFPTPVGVFPARPSPKRNAASLPHARGGVSASSTSTSSSTQSSPRPWGCFCAYAGPAGCHAVFPTPVGVFPPECRASSKFHRLPHARGGVSDPADAGPTAAQSSPRPWGCFHGVCHRLNCQAVFPTPVGVFLHGAPSAQSAPGLPHARGGVSTWRPIGSERTRSSPRPWGCFLRGACSPYRRQVFPTPVGVFLPERSRDPGFGVFPKPRGCSCPPAFTRTGVLPNNPNIRVRQCSCTPANSD